MTESGTNTKARIMIVEDEALVAKDLSLRLQRMKYQVVATCGTPEMALETALREVPDLILMDVNLNAGKDGIDVAIEIHQSHDIPIIFCTAYSSDDVLQRAKITEPYGYILKPIDSRELEINIEIALYKHAIENELHNSNDNLKVTLNNIADAVITCDENGKIVVTNPKAMVLCNIDFSPIGRRIDDIISLSDINTGINNVDINFWLSEKQACHHNNNYLLRGYSGGTIPVELNVASLSSINGKYNGLVFAFTDISRRLFFEEQLKKNAFQDPITKLPDRTMMFERLKLSVRKSMVDRNYSFAVVFFDLDKFHIINDGLSHEFGDEVLRIISQRIQSQLRDYDMLSRFSSDTFVCLLDSIRSVPYIVSIVKKIHAEIAEPISINAHHVNTTACSGIVLANQTNMDYDDYGKILRDADTAMYQAKLKGSNSHVIFDEKMHDLAIRLLWIEQELIQAIEDGDIHVYYQPVVSAKTHEITSFEALVRWIHPNKGFIPPDEFIPLAEEIGLIIPLGEYILHSVCKQLSIWNNELGLSVRVAVNLSARQFSQPNVAKMIMSTIELYGLTPNMVGFEVTETMAMTDVVETISILNSLVNIGVHISMDDFGTGYSSLSYLKKLPIHTLKIDRSFIMELELNFDDQAIVKAIIAMALELEFVILAEGVETKLQADILKELGCHFFQGFHFSRPMDIEKTTNLLMNIAEGKIAKKLPT